MPKPKAAKGKKEVAVEAADKAVISNGILKDEGTDAFDALLKPAANDVALKAEPTDVPVKSTTNGRGARGKKVDNKTVEKEEVPAKKAAVSKSRSKKKVVEEVEVIENGNGEVAVEEAKEEVVTKGKGGRGKRVVKEKSESVEKIENGITEEPEKEQDVVTNNKGKGSKKNAKTNKATTEDPNEVVSEPVVEEPKAADVKPAAKGGGRKKKSEEKDAGAVPSEVSKETISEKAPTKTGGRKKKTDDKSNNGAPAELLTEADPVVLEAPAKSGGRKKKVDDKEIIKNEISDNLNDNQDQPPKKKGRGGNKKSEPKSEEQPKVEVDSVKKGRSANKKSAAKEEDAASKAEEESTPAVGSPKKPTKRGTKDATKDKAEGEVEKIPAKRARATKPSSKMEEVSVDEAEDSSSKKRSRKEPSVEKELKPETEKPKKSRGAKRKAEKIDEEAAIVPKQGKEEDKSGNVEETEDSKKSDKPATSRGGKRAAPSANKAKTIGENLDDDDKNDVDAEDDEADGSKPSKAKKKKEPSAVPQNATTTKYNKSDFDLPPLPDGQTADEPRFNLKISSWNVAGLRSWVKKEGLRFLEYEEPDIFCLQETKCTTDQLPEEVARIPGYHPYWLCMPGGYAGVAIYSKIMPINVEYGIGDKGFDDVGRLITAEYEKFFLINVYVPNSGRKLVNLDPRMKWEKLFQEFVQKLNDRKPVVICGDMNVSHQEIDLANPKTNTRNAGFTKEEREKMSELLALGYVDTFRHLYPDRKGAYTFWTYMGNARSRNVGWRLDYFIVSERFIKRVVDNCIRSQCMGSDHCPITLFLKL